MTESLMPLNDIAAQANSASIVASPSSTDQQYSPVKISDIGKPHSPHFMTATIASKRSKFDKANDRAATHVSIKPIKSDGGNSLLKSAAKRVGFRRVAHETPRGKKESSIKHNRVVSFPDKLSTSPYPKIPDSPATPPKNNNDASRVSPLDKPLPTPPAAQLNMSNPVSSSTSLVEAIDKPLPSFASGSSSSEEWTILEPTRPLSPGTLQKMMRKTGNELKQQSLSGERYPKLGNATQQPLASYQRPVISRYSPLYQIPQKQVSPADVRKPSNTNGTLHVVNGLSEPFGDAAEMTDPFTSANAKASFESLTAAATAVEKSAKEGISISTPRQTKTSSLRARLSAGQLVKDEQTKILGFTDFTATRTSSDSSAGPSRRDSYRARKDAQARRSNESLQPSLRSKQSVPSLQKKKSALSLHSNKSTESLVKGHAPAQFVGGSRRPIPPPRPASRGSNRNISRGSISAPTSRPSSRQSQVPPPLPKKFTASNDSPYPITEHQVKPRKSSIPVPTHVALSAVVKGSSDSAATQRSIQTSFTHKKMPRNELAVFKDHSSAELVTKLEAEAVSSFNDRATAQILKDAKDPSALAAIEESPQHSFTTKRLSMKAPEYGPSLKISPSAERFIMGTLDADDANKENRPIHEKMTKSFLQKATNGVYKQHTSVANPASVVQRHSDRPLSSHGMLQSSPRQGLIDPHAREKKAKSADLSSTLSVNFYTTMDPSRKDTGASKGSKTSSCNVPFFDAQEELHNSIGDPARTPPKQDVDKEFIDEATWISPMKEKTGEALPEMEKTKSHSSTLSKDAAQDARAQCETLPATPMDRLDDRLEIEAGDFTQPIRYARTQMTKQQPFTPVQSHGKTPPSSGSHPPRSSSRVAHPNYTAFSPYATPITVEKGPPTPPKDKNRQQTIQNKLGSQHGHASSQIDIPNLESKRDSSIRGSIARDSFKSVGSPAVSKNPFSNLRNLFNKRSSTPETSNPRTNLKDASKPSSSGKISRSKDTKKVSITSTDSPFPNHSSTHPIHRPTLASSSRAVTPRNAPSAAITTPATPALTSPTPTSLSTTTTFAMNLLHAARNERSSPQKERLLQMSGIMVDAITQARDAEKAAEEARMASRRAELAREMCERMVAEVGRMVGEWRGGLSGVGGV